MFEKKNQEIFFVKSSELKSFASDHLKKINNNFILVTGDSDTEMRIDANQKNLELRDSILNILNNKNLVIWYSQNLFFEHEKIKSIPIGMDYHTVWEKENFGKIIGFHPHIKKKINIYFIQIKTIQRERKLDF